MTRIARVTNNDESAISRITGLTEMTRTRLIPC